MPCYGDTYCKLCGCPLIDKTMDILPQPWEDSGDKRNLEPDWLTDFLLLDSDNQIIDNLESDEGLMGRFIKKVKNDPRNKSGMSDMEKILTQMKYSESRRDDKQYREWDYVALHRICFNLTKAKVNDVYKLFVGYRGEFCTLDTSINKSLWKPTLCNIVVSNCYTRRVEYSHQYSIQKYQSQFFLFDELHNDKNEFVLSNPHDNDKCITRIENIIDLLINGRDSSIKREYCTPESCKQCYVWWKDRDGETIDKIDNWDNIYKKLIIENPRIMIFVSKEKATLELWDLAMKNYKQCPGENDLTKYIPKKIKKQLNL